MSVSRSLLNISTVDSLLGTATGDSTPPTEPESLPSDIPLDSLDLVAQQAPVIARSKEIVISEMENMVVQGLANLVCDLKVIRIQANH